MKITTIYKTLLFAIVLLSGQYRVKAQSPATETRAVWLTTNWNLDWPKANSSPEEQKKHLCSILDELQGLNFNTIFFQTRIRGDVFYKSKIEPWSIYFQKGGGIGSPSVYDPLAYAIEECHKRGLELHAWVVTYPVGSKNQVIDQGKNSVVAQYPKLCKFHQGEWYLDPGNPQTNNYLLGIVDEIVSNYDVDGIHFDYIRYPEAADKFADNDTYEKYGYGIPIGDWRRNNINNFVGKAYELIKKKKAWVQVSCSPIGKYKDLDPRNGKWAAFRSVYQDAGRWMQEGKMDAIYPMMYYNEPDFADYMKQWQELSNNRIVAPGLGTYRLNATDGDWALSDITNQLDIIRLHNAAGAVHYRAGNILENLKGIKNKLSNYYRFPAKTPALSWIDNTAPNSPCDIQVYRDTNGLIAIEWQSTDPQEEQTYTVYESTTEDFDIRKTSSIIMTRIKGNKLYVNTSDEERGVYYAVTASDRFRNESVPSFPVFFVLSSRLEK